MPEIVRARSGLYFILTWRVGPGRSGSCSTAKPSMYPSRSSTPASASLSLDDGMRTSSCIAMFALRMRVSMSAIGSVIVMCRLPSPARLGHAGQLARVRQLAQAHPAQAELPEHRPRPPAAAAPGVGAHLELGLALLLVDERFLRHLLHTPSRRNGNPIATRSALPSASVVAVVTMVMSMPRGWSMLS